MKHAFLAAVLILASSVAFADTASVLLNGEKVRNMSAEEYAAAVRGASSINVRGSNELSAIYIAAFYGTPDNIIALISAGADVNARTSHGYTPLHQAANSEKPDNIIILVGAGADVNARDEGGGTALHWAAATGTPDSIAALLSAGAHINARDQLGLTALHNAAVQGGSSVPAMNIIFPAKPANIIALLEAGASGSIKNNEGRTPFDVARDNDSLKGTPAYWALNDAQYK